MSLSREYTAAVEVSITAVAHGGDGIGRVDGMACFVSGALPDETVRVHIYRRAKNALWGRLLEILSPSPHRLPDDPCVGCACSAACAWHDFAYPAQGEWKRRIVGESIARIGGINTEVSFVDAPALRHGYRTRAVFHGDGLHLGYYTPRTHDVMPMSTCPLNHPRLNEAFELLHPMGLRGNIHVTVNPEGGETLVWLREVVPAVKEQFPLANHFDSRERSGFMFDGVPIVNGTFSQASLLLNRMLRHETDKHLGDAESLLDLYCGNGNLSLNHAGRCEVVGVDQAQAATAAANVVAPNAYRSGDEAMMARLVRKRAWDVILLDPPRTGAKALIESLAAAKSRRMVYVSCNPATFARDAHGLAAGGWRLTSVAALDMFPCTPHVETIGVFERL